MLEAKVAGFLDRHSFEMENKKIVVGVSGGPDSLALLHYLWGQRDKQTLSLVAAHVDHMFRGQESFEDALFVKDYCEQKGIPFEMARINVPQIIEKTKKNAQVASRQARYEFFEEIMGKYGYNYLALGHHGDDQVETILMRLTRGSSSAARAGIPFSRPFGNGFIFRPFLSLTKVELADYCQKQNLVPRIDPSNKKNIYSRNRFRHEVLPFLKAENQHVHEHFQRFSEDVQNDEILLQELTVQRMNKVMKMREKNKIIIDIIAFLEVPISLQRRGIQLILNYLYKVIPVSLSALHIDHVLSLTRNHHPSGTLDLPNGLKVIRSYSLLSFQFEVIEATPYSFELSGPGVIDLPNGARIRMDVIDGKENIETNGYYSLFPTDKIKLPIEIRTRKMGDRMNLKGMSGTKKLKDIFIDSKVPLQERDTWPVITDKNGWILWLPGIKKSVYEGINHSASQYILLTYHR
ncbi:tRNA(Ile)-lysidine synthase [Neobacillus niacini]|uniref:tRNA lysidine(34) synthetase TilS n=1 Tax=Neobacillus niacini TaxID=86668 RepID=UPI002861C05E|nr:tRNA lysidine(34) synthetase TilS [Neobacillus niacini]MDR7080334.1 tRNA(Ile)-lysidine synthase [Neobacillus niacini]